MEKKMEKKTLKDAEIDLANAVYEATGMIEDWEIQGSVRGNGHHIRQLIAAEAILILRKRWLGDGKPS